MYKLVPRFIFIIIFIPFINSYCQELGGYKIEKIENDRTIDIVCSYWGDIECSLYIEFYNVRNAWVDLSNQGSHVIKPNTYDTVIARVSRGSVYDKMSFEYRWYIYPGNYKKALHARDYTYSLPLKLDTCIAVLKGYNRGSHWRTKALDFRTPVGTQVFAMRPGIVIKVSESFDKGCGKPRCKRFANLILIEHEDGTLANYGHLKYGGSAVEVGESVVEGQLIGYSGNTGYSTEPHLHVGVKRPAATGLEYMDLNFRFMDADDQEVEIQGKDLEYPVKICL